MTATQQQTSAKAQTASRSKTKKRAKRTVSEGCVHIHATFNNTIVTFTDRQGNPLCWSSAGACGYKGSRKGTPFAAQESSDRAGRVAWGDFSMRMLSVYVNGPGPGRESAIRALMTIGFKIIEITDVTGIPHNGVRPPKRRRV